jgi:hypothetical protein
MMCNGKSKTSQENVPGHKYLEKYTISKLSFSVHYKSKFATSLHNDQNFM